MRLLPLSAFLLAACGTPDIDTQVTITQGLYGQLTQRCDTSGCVGAPRAGTPIAWFDRSPWPTDGGVAPEPVLTTTSGANGFYELALDSNVRGYLALGLQKATVGTAWFTATSVSIPKGLGRVDWQATAANEGRWTDVR